MANKKVRKKTKLTKKEKLFCEYIVEGRKGADAYIDSGMATKHEKTDRTVCRRKAFIYKNKPLFKEYIKELEEIVDDEIILNTRDCIRLLSDQALNGVIAEKPMKDKDGSIVIVKYNDAKLQQEAMRTIITHNDNIGDKGSEKITVVFENNSEEELED